MTTIRETIIAAAVTAIETAVAPVTVYRSRSEALRPGQLPAVVVRPLSDTPSERDGSLCWLSWELILAVDVIVGQDPPDQIADPMVEDIHAAIMAGDQSLGISGVTDVTARPVEFAAENQGDVTGMTRLLYGIRYRTRYADLTVAP